MYFKQFFDSLERTFTFITSIFRMIYRSSYQDRFSEKSVLVQICSIFTEEYPCRSVISIKLKSHFYVDVLL